jgi:hypothetical protein
LYNTAGMAVTIRMQNTGDSRASKESLAGVEHVLGDVAGEWRVSIVGSRANDNWEMKVETPGPDMIPIPYDDHWTFLS